MDWGIDIDIPRTTLLAALQIKASRGEASAADLATISQLQQRVATGPTGSGWPHRFLSPFVGFLAGVSATSGWGMLGALCFAGFAHRLAKAGIIPTSFAYGASAGALVTAPLAKLAREPGPYRLPIEERGVQSVPDALLVGTWAALRWASFPFRAGFAWGAGF